MLACSVQDANHNIVFNRLKLFMDNWHKSASKKQNIKTSTKVRLLPSWSNLFVHTQYQYIYFVNTKFQSDFMQWTFPYPDETQFAIPSEHKAILECGRSEMEARIMKRHKSVHVSKIPLQLSKSWPTYHTMISSHFNVKNRDLRWPIAGLNLAHKRPSAGPGRMVQNYTCWYASFAVELPKQRQVHCFGSPTV